ncbi:AraC family transcriptional regulator ligand-binding domain-containing protein [Paracoccus sp. (in: a-proteobacteria)]|uniref:AraC-like transcriptional regulator QhpR n=1 Tax=Paracoccus sp. TaxID=267 RepID=UPI003A87E7A4
MRSGEGVAVPENYHPKIVSSALSDPFRLCDGLGGASAEFRRLVRIEDISGQDEVSLKKFVAFLELAAQSLHRPDFGWSVGAVYDLENLGSFGRFVREAPSLGVALRFFCKAFAMVQSDSELELKVQDGEAVLSYRILDLGIWPRGQDAELTLSVLYHLIRSVAGPDWRPSLITLEHHAGPIWQDPANGPKCRVSSGAMANCMCFPARVLELPMRDTGKALFSGLSQAASDQCRKQEREAPVTIRVRREIIRRLGRDCLDQTRIAETLGFSRRTLRRRLEAEGQSFSDLLADCRMRQAERMLEETDRPLAAISVHLGYAEVSAFERAFKARGGVTPAQYRRRGGRASFGVDVTA